MDIEINLRKMASKLASPIAYTLGDSNQNILVNDWINKQVNISYNGEINCVHCQKKTKTSFFQGFCYSCFTTLPQTEPDVLRPELCEAHNGIARDMEWAKKNCLIDHYVYLAYTGNVKVGVTRHTQIPTRWIDQGASWAIKLAKVPYRQLAGEIEVELKQYVKDKTNWRKMLTNITELPIDLVEEKERFCELLPDALQYYIDEDDEVLELNYPVNIYPAKIKSINLDKTANFSGILVGIKGQYLIFEDGSVFNVRKHSGYKVKIKVEDKVPTTLF